MCDRVDVQVVAEVHRLLLHWVNRSRSTRTGGIFASADLNETLDVRDFFRHLGDCFSESYDVVVGLVAVSANAESDVVDFAVRDWPDLAATSVSLKSWRDVKRAFPTSPSNRAFVPAAATPGHHL